MPRGALIAIGLVAAAPVAIAQVSERSSETDLTDLSLEALMDIEVDVTSMSRKEQPVRDTAAAVFVISAEDIRRSGVTNIPDALRLVPGLHVAQMDANRWAISARGFGSQFANKMLVLIDGRTVYTPLFSGVYWDQQNVVLEDVERIEVVRGPGAALWGANAVNGVINVVTKSAHDTQGVMLVGGAGSELKGTATARYGGSFGDDGAWRIYGHGFDQDSLRTMGATDGSDDWKMAQGGFRADWGSNTRDSFTVQGDVYDGEVDNLFTRPIPVLPFLRTAVETTDASGVNLLGRWTRALDDDGELSLQGYYDRTERISQQYGEERDTFDLDFQHRFQPAEGHELIWGLGFRQSRADITRDTLFFTFGDLDRSDDLFSAFVHHEAALVPERVDFSWGAKFEHNDFTGHELQPNVRLMTRPTENQRIWAAASRAVRTPSQVEDDVRLVQAVIPGTPDTYLTMFGNDDLDAEEVLSYELGYRNQVNEDVHVDVAAFLNSYENLLTIEPGAPFLQGANIIQPMVFMNTSEAESYGVEVAIDWAARQDTHVQAGYTFFTIDVDGKGSADPTVKEEEGTAPHNQAYLRAEHDLARDWDLDGGLYYVDNLSLGAVPSYFRLDGRLEWRPAEGTSVVLGVQGLLHDGDAEYATGLLGASNEMQTAVYLKAIFRR
jgi:iron complex outermembrane receptor protein